MTISRIRQVINCASNPQQTYDVSFDGTPFHIEIHMDGVNYSGAGDGIVCRLSSDDNATEYYQAGDYYRGATYSSGDISTGTDTIMFLGRAGNGAATQSRAQIRGIGYAIKTVAAVIIDDGTGNQPRTTVVQREAATVENAMRIFTSGGSQTMNAGRIIITAYYSTNVTIIDLSSGTPATRHPLSGGTGATAWLSIHGANKGDRVEMRVTSGGTSVTSATYRQMVINNGLGQMQDGLTKFSLLETSPSGTDDKCAIHTIVGLGLAAPTMTHGTSMNRANAAPVSSFNGIHETATAYDGVAVIFDITAPDAGHILWVPS